MKYISSITKKVYDITPERKRDLCPECTSGRSKKNVKDLQYYKEDNRFYCFHCEATFFEYKPFEKKKEYLVPEWKNKTELTDKAVKYFESRMISQKTLNKMKVYSDNEYMPQFQKNVEVFCFPFFVNGELKNIKYRGAKKSFKLYSGAELIFYNFDELIKGNKIVYIVEGEIDALTYIENGLTNVISVPNGANNNLEYLDTCIDLFDNIDQVHLSLDNDEKGITLRDELIRRIGAEKCYTIDFKHKKDANDYFIAYGGIVFKETVLRAKEVPFKGIVRVSDIENEILDLYKNGVQKGKTISFDEIDKYCSWELQRLAIVTGIPGSGKSEFVDYIVTKLNLLHGWKAGYFTPENYPLKFHYAKLHEKYSGKKFKSTGNDADFYTAYEHINDNYYYIMNEDDMKVKTVIDAAKVLVKKHGIKILVLDPYNKFDHQAEKGDTETQYISKFLDQIINFAKFYNVLVILVAHPTKIDRDTIPNLYNISGSSHFYNKTDYGFTVHREKDEENIMTNDIQVHWQKIKFKHLGEQGISKLRYNYNNGRFEERKGDVHDWDNNDWFAKKLNNNDFINNEFEQIDECPF